MKPDVENCPVERFPRTLILLIVLFFAASTAQAQLSGHHAVGDFGMKSGSQAPPGAYVSYFLYGYDASTLVGNQGRELSFAQGGINVWAHIPILSVVTNRKFLGANYGAVFLFPVQNLSIEAPRVGLVQTTGYGPGDLYFQPVNLGWHKNRVDVTTWYGLFAPSGKYTAGADDNRGFGMWSHEWALGTTFYLDEKKTLHASALSSLEFHSKKEDSDVKVGTLWTIEGGAGITALKGGLNLGMAYYLQWKLTDDSGLGLPPLVENRLGKNRNFGLGPEATLVLPLNKDFTQLMILNFRYVFEVGTRLDTKGQVLVFSVTFKVR